MFTANFYPNYIVTFDKRKFDPNTTAQLPNANKVKGDLSKKSRLLMTKALSWMYLFSKKKWAVFKDETTGKTKQFQFRINFITLTLSDAQVHSDDWIKIHMLEPFLKWMKRKSATHYVWKAEAQDNGNIHFHITTEVFIHYAKIRDKWNSIQYKAGYLNNRMKRGLDDSPNSTDVHSVKNEKGFVAYMVKYMTKLEEMQKTKLHTKRVTFYDSPIEAAMMMGSICAVGLPVLKRKIEGKIWACSQDLLNIRVSMNVEDEYFSENFLQHSIATKAEWQKHDFCDTYHHKFLNIKSEFPKELGEKFQAAYNKYHGLN